MKQNVKGEAVRFLSVRLPEETYRELEQLAMSHERTVSGEVRLLVLRHLSEAKETA